MEILKATPRPVNILFCPSPDYQVTLPSTMDRITPQRMVLGYIEGYVMITANHMEWSQSDGCNLQMLAPGMVILQINKDNLSTGSSGSAYPLSSVYEMLNEASKPVQLAVRSDIG